jgi:branched-chain amino acid transport system ATP-binding protein
MKQSLEVANVSVSYGDHLAIQDISLTVPPGESRALLGPNGSGKSTLLNAIAGRLRVNSGRMTYGDHDLVASRRHDIPRLGIVLCPQEREIFGSLSVAENLELGGFIHRNDSKGFEAARSEVLDVFPKLSILLNRAGGSLSGGEQQMLAIGRALMARPDVLLLDEPSAGLAPIVVTAIFDVLRDLAAAGTMSILIAEQNVPKAFSITSYAYVLSNGRLHHEGKTSELAQDQGIVAAYFGGESVH